MNKEIEMPHSTFYLEKMAAQHTENGLKLPLAHSFSIIDAASIQNRYKNK
jgi:hypothetical protein